MFAGDERPIQPDGYSGNQAVGKFEDGTVFSCRCLDCGGCAVITGSRRDLLVLVEPGQGLRQLTGGSLQLKAVNDFVNRDAREREDAMLSGVAGCVADDGRMVSLEVFGKDICVEDGFDNRLKRGHRFRWPSSFIVGYGHNLIKEQGILATAE